MTKTVLDQPLADVLTDSVQEVREREASRLNELLEAKRNRCVIYGAGTLGRKAVALLGVMGITPLAVADSNPSRWGERDFRCSGPFTDRSCVSLWA
jgi:threonine dehydrogenase-like Zn-dependent dehydrogenase